MNYQDLQLLWDQQSKNSIFTIDHDAVITSVEKRCQTIDNGINWTERILIFCSLFAGIPLAVDPLITQYQRWPSIIVGVIFVIQGLFTWHLYRKRKTQERAYEQAVIPSIDKALFQNRYTVFMLKCWLLLFHIPSGIFAVIVLLLFPEERDSWMWFLFIGVIVYSIWDTPRNIRNKSQKEEALRAVRSQLLDISQRN